jgi:hypothetical protein
VIGRAVEALGVSERRACHILGQHRSVQRHAARPRPDEDALTAEIVGLASAYGRYGYRQVTALLRAAGWRVNAKRVERIWRREGLKVWTICVRSGDCQSLPYRNAATFLASSPGPMPSAVARTTSRT